MFETKSREQLLEEKKKLLEEKERMALEEEVKALRKQTRKRGPMENLIRSAARGTVGLLELASESTKPGPEKKKGKGKK